MMGRKIGYIVFIGSLILANLSIWRNAFMDKIPKSIAPMSDSIFLIINLIFLGSILAQLIFSFKDHGKPLLFPGSLRSRKVVIVIIIAGFLIPCIIFLAYEGLKVLSLAALVMLAFAFGFILYLIKDIKNMKKGSNILDTT